MRSKLCELPRLLERVVAAIGDEVAARPAPGAFAAVEHAWHLADLEREGFQARIARLRDEPAPWLPDFDGDRVAAERGYRTCDARAGVRAFVRARAETVAMLGRIRGAAWLRGGLQEGAGYVTLAQLPERILGHDRAHAVELAALVRALRPGHAVAAELAAWAETIGVVPPPPCGAAARRASLVLPAVQRVIARAIAASEAPSTAAVAEAVGLPVRTLQRRLAASGLTVRCLVGEARRALALAHLRTGPWRDAGAAAGYAADGRAFARAFRRRSAVTPAAFAAAGRAYARPCG